MKYKFFGLLILLMAFLVSCQKQAPDDSELAAQAYDCNIGVTTPTFPIVTMKEKSLSGSTVVIDPGHGRYWNGTSYPFESDFLFNEDLNNLNIAASVQTVLATAGAKVITTRALDYVSVGPNGLPLREYGAREALKWRGEQQGIWNSEGNAAPGSTCERGQDWRARPYLANSKNALAMISLHSNANSKGFEIFVYEPNGFEDRRGGNDPTSKATYSETWELARQIHKAAMKYIPESGGTVKSTINASGDFAMLRFSRVPVILIEIGSHFHEQNLVTNPAYQQAVGKAIRDGLNSLLASRKVRRFVASSNNLCLDVAGGSTADGVQIYSWGCHGGSNQTFRLVPHKDNSSRYFVVTHAGKCLDIAGWSLADNANVIQYNCHGGDNQQFTLSPYSSGYVLKNVRSNKCISALQNGGPVVQYSCMVSSAQIFMENPISPPVASSFTTRITRNTTNLAINYNIPTGNTVFLYPLDGTSDQNWIFSKVSGSGRDTVYLIKREGTDRCLNGYSPYNYSIVDTFPCSSSDGDQLYKIIPVSQYGSRAVMIQQVPRTGSYCFNADSPVTLRKLTLWTCSQTDTDQIWVLLDAPTSVFQ